MRTKGLPAKTILKKLERRLDRDFKFKSGLVLGSMCTSPHKLASQIFTKYLEKNIGDPGLFPETTKLEEEVIKTLGTLLSNPKSQGNIVSGGTEANLLALYAAKTAHKSKKNQGEIILPISAHCSFNKATNILGLKQIRIKLNEKYHVDIDSIRSKINDKTIAIIGIAGTTGLGAVDNIPALSEIALENNLFLHVDAAFGGFVLPFLEELGYEAPVFDFRLNGVHSITIDPHKMGLAPIPAGGILFKNSELRETVTWQVPYLAGGPTKQSTMIGSRSGASVVAVWALLEHLGREGYRNMVKSCMDMTWKLVDEIQQIKGLDVMVEPTINIIGIKSEAGNIEKIAQKLRKNGWAVSLFPQHIRIVVMPHIKEEHVNNFIEQLRLITRKDLS